jgi:NAD(P)-dependent dehydrogenase (short-subunit alcohol dehydrogenase family)
VPARTAEIPSVMSLLSTPFDPAREAALVTGAGNGIGRAIAQALVGEGVRTVFADIREDTVTAAVKASARPELGCTFVGDLARRDACDQLLAASATAVGRVTHFVHSASPPRREVDHALAVGHESWQDACRQSRRRLSPRARTGAKADLGQ